MAELKTTIPKGSWILVSGANGYVASYVIKMFLERGYRVRGTVRSIPRTSWLTESLFKQYADRGFFELVEVLDLGAPHAFDEAIKGVSAVAHVATVGTFDTNPDNVIPPVIQSVVGLLEAASREPSVKAFVYTSSVAAAAMPIPGMKAEIKADTFNETAIKLTQAPPPYDSGRGFVVYAASKTEGEKALWKFVEEKAPHFTVSVVFPAAIMGEALSKTHLETPYAYIKALYDGKQEFLSTMPATIHNDVKDTALLHVAAILDPEVGNARLPGWGTPCNWNDILAILRKQHPDIKFMDDLEGMGQLALTTDSTQALGLLEKWGGQKGWKSLEETLAENMASILKYFPRE